MECANDARVRHISPPGGRVLTGEGKDTRPSVVFVDTIAISILISAQISKD